MTNQELREEIREAVMGDTRPHLPEIEAALNFTIGKLLALCKREREAERGSILAALKAEEKRLRDGIGECRHHPDGAHCAAGECHDCQTRSDDTVAALTATGSVEIATAHDPR